MAVLIPSSLCLGCSDSAFVCREGVCGKGKTWKTQIILLGDFAEKRNSDYCFVLASVSISGPLRSKSLVCTDCAE